MEILGEPTPVIEDLAKVLAIQPGYTLMLEGLLVYRYLEEERPNNIPRDYAIPYLHKDDLTASEVVVILDAKRKGK